MHMYRAFYADILTFKSNGVPMVLLASPEGNKITQIPGISEKSLYSGAISLNPKVVSSAGNNGIEYLIQTLYNPVLPM